MDRRVTNDPLTTCADCKKNGFHCPAHRKPPSWWWKVRYGQPPLAVRKRVPNWMKYGKFGVLTRKAPKWLPGCIQDQWILQTRRLHIYIPADSRMTRATRRAIERAMFMPKSWETNYGKFIPPKNPFPRI